MDLSLTTRSPRSPVRSKVLPLFVVTALFAASAPASAWDEPSDLRALAELRALYARYRCPVTDRLQRLYETGDPAKDRDRFIVIAIRGREDDYVQCRFHDHETTMLCEAASGFYLDKPGTPRTTHLPRDKIAALGRLGFSTDESAGNFALETKVATPPDFRRIAELILRALHDGYEAQASTPLEFAAPFAPGLTFACDAVG